MSEPNWELLGGGGVIGGPIDYIGDWAADVTYQPGQIVRYNGVDYISVNPSVGQVPPASTPVVGAMKLLYDSGPIAAAVATLTTSTLPQTYRDLVFVLTGRVAAAARNVGLRCSGDASGLYDYGYIQGVGGAVSSSAANGNTSVPIVGVLAMSTTPANTHGCIEGTILDYANTTRFKSGNAHSGGDFGLGGGADLFLSTYAWRSLAAVTSLTFLGAANFEIGSRLCVYGRG